MARKPQATQMSSKGQTTYHLHGTPRTLPAEEENTGEKTEEGKSPCSSLESSHNSQLLHQEGKKKECITEETGKKKVTLLYLGTGCESGELYLHH